MKVKTPQEKCCRFPHMITMPLTDSTSTAITSIKTSTFGSKASTITTRKAATSAIGPTVQAVETTTPHH